MPKFECHLSNRPKKVSQKEWEEACIWTDKEVKLYPSFYLIIIERNCVIISFISDLDVTKLQTGVSVNSEKQDESCLMEESSAC